MSLSSSRRAGAVVLVAAMLASRPARAAEVELLAGYGKELAMLVDGGQTAYGVGYGCRAGTTTPSGVYLGGTFVQHVGLFEWAQDAAGTSTYRASYHETYVAAELGYAPALASRPLLFRPYIAAGARIAIARTELGHAERREERVLPIVAPGALTGIVLGPWMVGLDVRIVMTLPSSVGLWAPAAFLVLGTAP